MFRSGNGGTIWTALDLPSTVEAGGVIFGIHPGGQASIHMSMAADRSNKDVVYIGGDRQVGSDEALGTAPRWPNAVGATDYSGRIFRVDAARPSGQQATHLTHSNTASRSAPHADSRDMAMDANGELIETDDGGIYRRTKPLANSGDWFSMNGDLQVTEFHSLAWDGGLAHSSAALRIPERRNRLPQGAPGGAASRPATAGPRRSLRPADFLRVTRVIITSGFSPRSLQRNRRAPKPDLYPVGGSGGGASIVPHFYTPIEINRVTPARLIIGAANSVYD